MSIVRTDPFDDPFDAPVYDGTTAASSLPALVQASDDVTELLDEIEVQAKKQQARSGVSLEKSAALQALGDAAFEVASAVHACAVANGDREVAGKVDYSRAELTRGADKTIINRAEEIREVASTVLNSLVDYGVTQGKLSNLSRKIDAFRKAHPAPRQRVNASSAATKQLSDLFPQLTDLLHERVDRLVVQFKDSAPDFYNEYKAARVIVDPATGSRTSAKADAAAKNLPKAA